MPRCNQSERRFRSPLNSCHGRILGSAVAIAGSLWFSSAAHAVFINTSISNPGTTISFQEIVLAPSTALTNQYAGLGITFQSGMFYDPVNLSNSGNFFFGLSGHAIGNFNDLQGATAVSPISVFFTSPVNAASFAMVSNSGLSSFRALLNGVQVDTGSSATGLAATIVGFSGLLFDEIEITVASGTGRFDTFQFSSPSAIVPLPPALLLFASGLGAMGALGWRRNRRKNGDKQL